MDRPLVSVIIACYNAENYIDQCFEALIGQTYQNIEIVVCDDGSNDGTIDIVKQVVLMHPEICWIIQQIFPIWV